MRAGRLEPWRTRTLENLGKLHAELDQPQPARRAWAQALELYTVAGAGDEAGQVREAIADLDR